MCVASVYRGTGGCHRASRMYLLLSLFLEEYGAQWIPHEIHNRARNALRMGLAAQFRGLCFCFWRALDPTRDSESCIKCTKSAFSCSVLRGAL